MKLSIQYNNKELLQEELQADLSLYNHFNKKYITTASGLEAYYFDFITNKDHSLTSEYSGSGTKIALCVSGHSLNVASDKKQYSFDANKVLLYKTREGKSRSFLKKEENVKIMHLYVPDVFAHEMSKKDQNDFFSIPLNSFYKNQITEIFNPSYKGIFKDAYTESLMMSMLSGLLISFEQKCFDPGFKPSKEIIEALEILDCNTENIISIHELSRRVGVNEFKLKKEFRLLTGKGVFAYQQEKILEQSVYFLQQGMTVTEATEKAGYSSIGNFSNAFYKKYGCRPGDLK